MNLAKVFNKNKFQTLKIKYDKARQDLMDKYLRLPDISCKNENKVVINPDKTQKYKISPQDTYYKMLRNIDKRINLKEYDNKWDLETRTGLTDLAKSIIKHLTTDQLRDPSLLTHLIQKKHINFAVFLVRQLKKRGVKLHLDPNKQILSNIAYQKSELLYKYIQTCS